MKSNREKIESNNNQDNLSKKISIPPSSSFAILPIDLLHQVADIKKTTSITSVASESDALLVMRKLSQTCKGFYRFYKPELEKQAAKKLLHCVLKPTTQNVEKAKQMMLVNPTLIYVKAVADDFTRTIEGSALQAVLGAGNIGWLYWMWKEIITKTKTEAIALLQYDEQLGKPDERNARMLAQMDKDLEEIAKAITQDPCTNGKPTLDNTEKSLQAMRDHLVPESDEIIKTGKHFPLEMLLKTYEVYAKNWRDHKWDNNRRACYSCFVIGRVLSFCTAGDILRLLKGLENDIDETALHCGKFEFKVAGRVTHLLPRDVDPHFRPGFDFFLDVYNGVIMTCGKKLCNSSYFVEYLCRQKIKYLEGFKQLLQKPTANCQIV